jgi:hypothetical protein
MRVLWTLVKLVIGLVLVIPISIIVLAAVLGVFGALLGLAILALKLAVVGLIAWGGFRVITGLLRTSTVRARPAVRSRPEEIADAPKADPYYEAAVRELDRDLGAAR